MISAKRQTRTLLQNTLENLSRILPHFVKKNRAHFHKISQKELQYTYQRSMEKKTD